MNPVTKFIYNINFKYVTFSCVKRLTILHKQMLVPNSKRHICHLSSKQDIYATSRWTFIFQIHIYTHILIFYDELMQVQFLCCLFLCKYAQSWQVLFKYNCIVMSLMYQFKRYSSLFSLQMVEITDSGFSDNIEIMINQNNLTGIFIPINEDLGCLTMPHSNQLTILSEIYDCFINGQAN